ncbi:MAG: hypothetical protein EPN40_05235 [Rhodanobacteraceae bacterium]|nr:MAG: hypothetical protein EPN40_05235 [Rhodanobacteraceae bacterium]
MSKMSENASSGLPHDDEIEVRARAIFRNACESTDSYHALRLGLARRKALNAGAGHTAMRMWAPLAGAAACCALVVGVLWMRPVAHVISDTGVASSAPIVTGHSENDEFAPEVSGNQMELVQNLDFYRWLATQPTVASASAGDGH